MNRLQAARAYDVFPVSKCSSDKIFARNSEGRRVQYDPKKEKDELKEVWNLFSSRPRRRGSRPPLAHLSLSLDRIGRVFLLSYAQRSYQSYISRQERHHTL